ncbi:hypothetical protein DENSPDRAFT_742836, partial [Dentipellis sp. KUC8613]
RMGRDTFDQLVARLEECDVFVSTGRKPQRPVRYQLGCFLIRFGMRGTDALTVAQMMGIGFGTVFLYCNRVTYALRKLGQEYVTWGDEFRHQVTKEYVQLRTGIQGCIGMLDGTLIQLTEPPSLSAATYFCRKKFAAINVQAIVDHLRRFISFDLGWPGSVPDVSIWKQSHIWRNRGEYFQDGEFVLAD